MSSPEINRPWRVADHSLPCVAEVKNERSFASTSLYTLWYAEGRVLLAWPWVAVNAKLPVCLIQHHTMKSYWGVEVELHVFVRTRSFVNVSWPHNMTALIPVTDAPRGWMDLRGSLCGHFQEEKSPPLPGIDPKFFERTATLFNRQVCVPMVPFLRQP